MQYTDTEAALIGGLISNYFFQPAVDASLKDAYGRVLEHLHQNALTSSDLQQIRKAVNFNIFVLRAFLLLIYSNFICFFTAIPNLSFYIFSHSPCV